VFLRPQVQRRGHLALLQPANRDQGVT